MKNSEYSELYRKIWEISLQIPKGTVATYGQIAKLAGLGKNARIIGYALNKLPENSNVPWHRIINAQGKISLRKGSASHKIQKILLEKEGIIFENEKIDLNRYGWKPD